MEYVEGKPIDLYAAGSGLRQKISSVSRSAPPSATCTGTWWCIAT